MPEPDYWTTHNNFENMSMSGIGLVFEKGEQCWDWAKQEWSIADTPVYSQEVIDGIQSENDKLRETLERLTRAATEVNRFGATTGSQWFRLSAALVSARMVLNSAKGTTK